MRALISKRKYAEKWTTPVLLILLVVSFYFGFIIGRQMVLTANVVFSNKAVAFGNGGTSITFTFTGIVVNSKYQIEGTVTYTPFAETGNIICTDDSNNPYTTIYISTALQLCRTYFKATVSTVIITIKSPDTTQFQRSGAELSLVTTVVGT